MMTISNPRITPAYAGNTYIQNSHSTGLRDHPRLRGEHRLISSRLAFLIGSPPPTRGTLLLLLFEMDSYRITPAYAGNTVHTVSTQHESGDHPRLRGEHSHEHK